MHDFLKMGRNALAAGAWREARGHLERAVELEESAEAFEELAWSCWWLNDAPSVFQYRSKSYKLFLEKNDKRGASRTAGWIGVDHLEVKGEFAVAAGWFQRAENLLEGLPDSWELSFVKILKARLAYEVDKNIELALKLIDETRELSKSIKSVNAEIVAGALKGFILVSEGRVSEGMPLLDEATLLAVTSEEADIKFTTITCCYLIDACERIRDYERAGQWCNNVKELCKRWDYKEMFSTCRVKYAGILVWRGEWVEAEDELLAAAADFKEIRPKQVNACTVRLADLKRRQGKWDEAETLLNEATSHPIKLLAHALLCFDKGDYKDAQNLAEKYLHRFSINRKAERLTGVELLFRVWLKLGRIEEAEGLLRELRETSEAINTRPVKAALSSAEGAFYHTIDKLNDARLCLEYAVDIYEDIKSPFESSRTRLALARVLVELNLHSQAEAELNAVMTTCKEIGAQRDFGKAKSLLKNLYKSQADELDKNKFEFTIRELEVLKSIAEGRNNEEIADTLFLSIRTVEKHITNIYSKLGVSGKSARAYAASYAIKNKLILT